MVAVLWGSRRWYLAGAHETPDDLGFGVFFSKQAKVSHV